MASGDMLELAQSQNQVRSKRHVVRSSRILTSVTHRIINGIILLVICRL